MELPSHPVQYKNIHYDPQQQVFLRNNNERFELRPKTCAMFIFLIQNNGKTVSKDEILNAIWPGRSVTPDSIVQCISEIREALGKEERKLLQTVPNHGYRLARFEKQPIPEALLPLVGREKELSDLKEILQKPDGRLVCLSGLGGIGKSRLAQALGQWADTILKDGVAFVSLAAVQKKELVPEAIAQSMNVVLQGSRSTSEQLVTELKYQERLLILDNMEHLLSASAFCTHLLEQAADLKILITSRVEPDIYGAWHYRLQGLMLPDTTKHVLDNPSYRLFLQTARRENYQFQPTPQEVSHIIDICRLVGGIPLGIEIAATSTQQFSSCEEVLAEMRSQVMTPTSQTTTADANIHTASLDSVLKQSWQMLSQREKTVMQSLGLFRGKFNRDAAIAVTKATHDDFTGLIKKSMLIRNHDGYFVLHEAIRQYACEQALTSHNSATSIHNFIDYHLQKASQANEKILGGQQFQLLHDLELEHANLRESLTLCLTANASAFPENRHIESGLRLAGSLGWFWFLANHWKEGRGWAEKSLSLDAEMHNSENRCLALLTAGGLATLLDEYPTAYQRLSEGIQIAREADQPINLARGLSVMGILRRLQGNFTASISTAQESIALFKQHQDWGGYMLNLGWIGQAFLAKGHYEEALPMFEECLRLNRQVGNTISLPHALVNLAYVQWKLKQFPIARAYLDKAITTSEQYGILLYRAQALYCYGWLELEDNHLNKAHAYFQESAKNYLRLGDNTGLADVLEGLATLCIKQGRYKQAGQLMGGADGIRDNLKAVALPESEKLGRQLLTEISKHLSPEELTLHKNLGLASETEVLLMI